MASGRIVATWSATRYLVVLYRDVNGYFFQGDGIGGSLGAFDVAADKQDSAAIAYMEWRIAAGGFQPDTNKTPFVRES